MRDDSGLITFSGPEIPRPKGVSIRTFRDICNYCERYFKLNNGALAPIREIHISTGLTEGKISKVLNSTEFHVEMDRRGCRWETNKVYGLTPQQHMAINVLTNPTDRRTLEKKLAGIGLSYNQYTNWMRQPAFAKAVEQIAEQMLHDNIGNIHSRLVNKADGGDMQAIKLYYGLTGRYQEGSQQMLDFARAMGLILEVLTRHIRDQETLKRISADIDKIMAGGVPRNDGEIPANYVESHVVDPQTIVPIEPRTWTPPTTPKYGSIPSVPDLPDDFFE